MNKLFLLIIFSFIISAEFKSQRQYGIEQQLHAPCCWGGVIAEHDSPMSEAIKSVISALISDDFNIKNINSALIKTYENENILDYSSKFVKAKMIDEEIINFFVGIHGEKVRALPENKGLGWIAWKLPTFVLILSLIIAIKIVNNFRSIAIQNPPKIDNNNFKNVDKAMKEMGI